MYALDTHLYPEPHHLTDELQEYLTWDICLMSPQGFSLTSWVNVLCKITSAALCLQQGSHLTINSQIKPDEDQKISNPTA